MKLKVTHTDMLRHCEAAWRKAPINPDICITFSSGGLFTTGYFQKVGMPKVPVYALPWSRSNGKIVGASLESVIPLSVRLRSKTVAVCDDVFDSGLTILTFTMQCLRARWNVEMNMYAPYWKHGCPVPKYHCGCQVDNKVWLEFCWEP